MLKLAFHNVLLVTAVLVVGAGTVEYLTLHQFVPAPFLVAAILVVLSLVARRWLRPAAFIAIALSIFIPIGAYRAYLRGELVWLVPIFDTLVFAWLLWNAVIAAKILRKRKTTPA